MSVGRTAPAFAGLLSFLLILSILAPAAPASPPWYTETIEGGSAVGDYIRCAVDHDGTPHVVYWDYINTFLWYATRTDGVWTTDVIAAEVFLGTDIDIAVDQQRVPHVSYHAYNANGIDELRYSTRVGGVWNTVNVDPSSNDVGKYNSIAIDSQGRPHIAYYNETLQILKYAVKTGAWSIETADAAVNTGRFADMVLDHSDRPHIAYYVDGVNGSRYATKIGSTWHIETVSSGLADYGGIALDPADNPVITWNSGGYLGLYIHTIGAFQNLGGFSSTTNNDGAIAIGNDGTVHVLYQSVKDAANDLWYLSYRDSVGTLSPAAVGGTINLGSKCDVGVDPYGNPLGVYYDATHGDAMFIDSGVRLSTPLSGVTWPVGAERTITWRGAGAVNLLLSTDGGASYQALATGLTGSGGGGGAYSFTVPHQPSRFCKIKLERTAPYSASLNDSLFTIEASVALLNFAVTPGTDGNSLSWSTNPGPADLAGYRLERRRDEGSWSTLVPLTRKASYTDSDGRRGDEYRLFAVNGLGQELLLGNGSSSATPALTALAVYPNPFSTGQVTVDFATAGGLGGGAGWATVAVYDVAGRLVRTLANQSYAAGMQRATWDGRDAQGTAVASGVYFVRSTTGADTHTRKVLVVR